MRKPVVLLLLSLLFSGCGAPTSSYYLGARVDPQSILPLPAADARGLAWEDLYLRVDYDLLRQGEQLVIDGKLAFAGYPKMNLARFKDLSLMLYLVDGQGVVRQYLQLSRPLGTDLEGVFPFRRQIPLPPAVSALSFGYEGELITEEGGIEMFWKRPRR